MPLNRDYPKSFINERSAEYILVPNLKSILLEKFSTVTPLFPWATREGSVLSKQIHGLLWFRPGSDIRRDEALRY